MRPICHDLYCFRVSPVFIPSGFTDTTGEVKTNPGWLTTTRTSSGTKRWDATLANEDRNKENQSVQGPGQGRGRGPAGRGQDGAQAEAAGAQGDFEATREG